VRVHYTGTLVDGTVFDSSRDRDPLEFTIGKGEVIPGFERAVVGMRTGTSVIENVPASQAFGEYDRQRVLRIGTDQLPRGEVPERGRPIDLVMADGRKVRGTVREVADTTILVDTNHPLAGKDITFEIQLLAITSGRKLELGKVPPGARESKIILP
jgi:FKBP-type peptidyl-prolyl cis-trans isomerase 2